MSSNIRLAAWTIIAALILAGCADTPGPTMPDSRTHSTTSNGPTLSGRELQDAEFMALLIKWAKRDNYPLGDRDQLIAAGAQVCASMDQGETMIGASADLMDTFGLSGKQASAVGVAAVEVYCPEHTP